MDQVRKVLTWLKQHHFWVLSVLIVLIGLFCWWSASGTMSKQYTENQSKITTGFQTVQAVKSDAFHPNDNVKQRQLEETSKLSAEVAELWQKLYAAQHEKVLQWPDDLNAQFRETVEKLEFGQEIPDDAGLREHYQNYIDKHFPELPEKIGARAIDESQAGTAGGGAPGFSRRGSSSPEGGGVVGVDGQLEDDSDYICEWADADQAAVRAELEFPQTPSPLRIWWTQENLWVYHTLLDVIKNTNEAAHATRMSNAAVRGIYSLQVGRPAAQFSRTPNRIYKLPTAVAEVESGVGGELPPGSPEGAPTEFAAGPEFTAGPDGQGEMTPEQEYAFLFNGRYLGEDGKPISVAGGGAPAGGDPTMTAEASVPSGPVDLSIFGKEYKRLPVRMVLEMDQRHLPRLIAECAIRPLQIEVQEVRINAPDIMGGGSGAGGPSMNFSEGGMGAGSLIPDLTGLQEFNPHPEIVTVAIQGVIYIFNKPNAELLKPPADDAAIAQAP